MHNYRIEERYSQEQMASFLDVSQPTYCNWESGRTKIDLSYLPGIALQCRLRLWDILPENFKDGIRKGGCD